MLNIEQRRSSRGLVAAMFATAWSGAQYAVLAGVALAGVHKVKLMGFRLVGGSDSADGAPALHAIDCAVQSL